MTQFDRLSLNDKENLERLFLPKFNLFFEQLNLDNYDD